MTVALVARPVHSTPKSLLSYVHANAVVFAAAEADWLLPAMFPQQ